MYICFVCDVLLAMTYILGQRTWDDIYIMYNFYDPECVFPVYGELTVRVARLCGWCSKQKMS